MSEEISVFPLVESVEESHSSQFLVWNARMVYDLHGSDRGVKTLLKDGHFFVGLLLDRVKGDGRCVPVQGRNSRSGPLVGGTDPQEQCLCIHCLTDRVVIPDGMDLSDSVD